MAGSKGYRLPIISRFMANVGPETDTGCRLWIGGKNWQGYGRFWHEGHTYNAHRITAIAFYGSVAARGKMACHKCDTPDCVNPRHIFFGSGKQNQSDAVNKGRHSAQQEGHHSKLTKEQALIIFSSTKRTGVLAREYGVNDATVSDIRHGRTWTKYTGGVK